MADSRTYAADLHGVQSGVAAEIGHHGEAASAASAKHLRVGVNAAMADHAGLVTLLMAKGVFTEAEYIDAIAASMRKERERYEAHLSELFGRKVLLG